MSRHHCPSAGWLGAVILLAVFAGGCVYEAPLTAKPTRKIDERLLGDWVEDQAKGKDLKIRKLDDSHYVIFYDEFYKAHHSDIGEEHFVSIQQIDPVSEKDRKYTFATYELKDDGKTLVVRTVNDKTIPDTLKTSAALEKAVRANLKNPDLLNKDGGTFVRPKPATPPSDQGSPSPTP
ncbi:MAG TPA: hypothetical protein VGG94_04525 [Chthoniobacterales bacterium]|jgi:hypothetical protein